MNNPATNALFPDMKPDGDGLTTTVAEDWKQGRTTYGGYTAAMLHAAALHAEDGLAPLRSAVVNFTGPISSAPHLTTRTLRKGRNVATVEARAEIEGETAALAVFSFGAALPGVGDRDRPAPPAAPPETLDPLIPKEAARVVPAFMSQIDMRLIEGQRPYSGADEGYIRCWARLSDPAMRGTATSLLCLADCLPPAVFPTLSKLVRNGSVNWIYNVLTEDYGDENSWFQTETRLTAARDGYSTQVMRMWDQSGRLAVEGMQSVIVFG